MVLAFVIGSLSMLSDIIYWIKWTVAYLTIRIYKRYHHRRFDLYDPNTVNDPVKLGILVPQAEIDLESPFSESHLLTAADGVFFYGVNSKSEFAIFRIARCCNEEAEAWIYLKLANGKTYQLAETFGYQQTYSDKCSTFSCGGLQMHYLSPMRRWRIFYCGMLNDITHDSKSSQEMVFVKLAFLWKASSDVYDVSSDFDSRTTAKAFANVKWKFPFFPPLMRLREVLDMYCQSGFITGTVSVDENPVYEMGLFGEKWRYMGKLSSTTGYKFKHILGSTPENGFKFHLGKASVSDVFDKLSFGFVVQPDGELKAVEEVDITSKMFNSDKSASNLKAKFTADKKYELSGDITGKPIIFKRGEGWRGHLELRYIEFEIKNSKGCGLMIFGDIFTDGVEKTLAKSHKIPKDIPLTVRFTDEASQFPEITGGKGSSLGKLTKLSLLDKTFTVPKGVVVTTAAYNEFITSEILEEIKDLENVAYGNVVGEAVVSCKRVSSIIVNTSLPNKICKDIESHLNALFYGNMHHHKFAVRSSATGEDTDQMSAAGQMETFLGVQGLKEIFIALKKCWASQFGYIAVEYKRRNGQILNSPMAVVIQEMVNCDVSGVLFTCDPVTNNPSVITITANYGLGESVVSGSEEPDTVILQRRTGNRVSFKSKHLGAKHHKITVQEDSGTITEDVPEAERKSLCLSIPMAEKLGNLAIKIERYNKSPRDIEWGIKDEKIYILQSRPITSGYGETDFEIQHEFDGPLVCELEYFTKCNIGEVMPGAASPLGLDVLMKYISCAFKKKTLAERQINSFMQNKYFPIGCVPFYGHLMLTVVDLVSRLGDLNSVASQGMTIGMFGRLLDEPEIFRLAEERATKVPKNLIKRYLEFIWNLFFTGLKTPKLRKTVENYRLPFEKCKSSEEVFDLVMHSCSASDEALVNHLTCTEVSSIWNMFLFAVLAEANGSVNTEVYDDFAKFLSTSSNVESADVPATIQNLAYSISKNVNSEEFKAMNVQDAENWLLTSNTASGEQFRTFLKRHGHRCLKEYDIRSITWEQDSKPLVKLLQNLCGVTENTSKRDGNIEKIFSDLHKPLNFKSRWWIKFLLPNCRKGVRNREAGKSILMKAVNNWRKDYQYLGKCMVAEGRIPDADLLNFFTIDEIHDFLKTRSPKTLAKANHRRKMFPTLDKYIFPEIMKGVPKPINEVENNEEEDFIPDLTMKGIPVSQGVTKGTARVALSLEEASFLEPGEILITYSTDIGWSPYFPILSGVVTELGGLISHGAVVSREYGLPCVVGLHGATRKFQTGDYVLLDGSKGILQRLPKTES